MAHRILYYLDKADSDTLKFVELDDPVTLDSIKNAISKTEGKDVEDLYEKITINGKEKHIVTRRLDEQNPWQGCWWIKFKDIGMTRFSKISNSSSFETIS
jgi:hypothetical protein